MEALFWKALPTGLPWPPGAKCPGIPLHRPPATRLGVVRDVPDLIEGERDYEGNFRVVTKRLGATGKAVVGYWGLGKRLGLLLG